MRLGTRLRRRHRSSFSGDPSGSEPDRSPEFARGLRALIARPRRRILLAGALVLVAALVTALVRGGGGESANATTAPTTLASVEARDLVVSDTYEGRLGFGEAREYVTDRAGVVTAVAAVGSTVEPGGTLFSVDFEPTVVLAGSVPAYRALDVDASDGPDVAQLEQALVDLGYDDDLTVDEDFNSATAAAVERWEEDLGRAEPDGRVELGDVAFVAGPVRVGSVASGVGVRVQEGSTVVEATPTERVVTVDLDATRSNELEPGTQVGLTMPDGTETTGTVTTIGSEASGGDGNTGDPFGPGGGPTVPVTIALDELDAAGDFDSGGVDVAMERSRESGATAVPVDALLALVEGGYAVELVREGGGPTRLVAVEVGTYADGWVGVDGEGVEPGAQVVVPV